jgi:hypothetical protein
MFAAQGKQFVGMRRRVWADVDVATDENPRVMFTVLAMHEYSVTQHTRADEVPESVA